MLTGTLPETMKLKTEEARFGITIRPASVNNTPNEQPVEFGLSQNYPNPLTPVQPCKVYDTRIGSSTHSGL